jgi:GntR family transcriptional regulator
VTVGVDPLSDRPVYRQIADIVRQRISSGELVQGAQLPSERDLMESFNASRGTVRQAPACVNGSGRV